MLIDTCILDQYLIDTQLTHLLTLEQQSVNILVDSSQELTKLILISRHATECQLIHMSQPTLRVSLGASLCGCQTIHRIWHAYKNYLF